MAPLRYRALLLLAIAALTTAQLTGLPTLTTDDVVLGASTTSASAPTSAAKTTASSDPATSKTATSGNAATTTSSSIIGGLTNAPTLYGVGIPALIVPDTSDAPFMQKSSLPEGFVFICVGAILAFLGLSVILWRAIVAWSLHRSVKRAASDRYLSEKKSMFGAPTDYSGYQSTNMSMDNLSKDVYHRNDSMQRHKSPNKSGRHSRDPSSLFFSPTAGGAQRSTRSSTYLPSGYYASGSATLGSGSGFTHLGGAPAGYGRVGEASADSPPSTRPQSRHLYDRSPSSDRLNTLDVPARESQHKRSQSGQGTSTDYLSGGQRAPSAVLDELFDHHTSMR